MKIDPVKRENSRRKRRARVNENFTVEDGIFIFLRADPRPFRAGRMSIVAASVANILKNGVY